MKKLSEDIWLCRAGRPDEWTMDRWVRLAQELEQQNAELEKALLFIRDECDWEEGMGGSRGDNRIGPAIDKVLAKQKEGERCVNIGRW